MTRYTRLEQHISDVAQAITRLDAKVDANNKVAEQVVQTQLAQQQSLDRRVNDLKSEVGEVRSVAANDLDRHVHTKNPHPEQEEWLRKHFEAVGGEINGLAGKVETIKETLTSWRGSLKVAAAVYLLLATIIGGIISALIIKAIG